MSQILIDAAAFIALNSPRDANAQNARSAIKRLQGDTMRLVTTDCIINETATYLLTSIKGGYHHASRFLEKIISSNSPYTIEWIGEKRFRAAKEIFCRYNKDKSWSFTDCTSYVVMKELKINTVFTFDEHFSQMGFSIL